MKIDLSQVENIEDIRGVPAGEYLCEVVECRESESPAGHTRYGLRLQVVGGEFDGRTACWDSLHFSERGLPRVKFIMQMLDMGLEQLDPADFVGRRALVQMETQEREDPVTGIRRIQNRVPFAGYAPDPKADAEFLFLAAVGVIDPAQRIEQLRQALSDMLRIIAKGRILSGSEQLRHDLAKQALEGQA